MLVVVTTEELAPVLPPWEAAAAHPPSAIAAARRAAGAANLNRALRAPDPRDGCPDTSQQARATYSRGARDRKCESD